MSAVSAIPALPQDPLTRLAALIDVGGPMMWVIAALSVATVALILWKAWRMVRLGLFWGAGRIGRALTLWQAGETAAAQAQLARRGGARAAVVRAAMAAALDPALPRPAAEAETERVARTWLTRARSGLRGLELAAAIGPLLGLLGTVTGMIAAFQGLQSAGSRADTATLAGGIWEALLTTAAGMAVAIPAMIALAWFDGLVERLRHDMEDDATRVFLRHPRTTALHLVHPAAE